MSQEIVLLVSGIVLLMIVMEIYPFNMKELSSMLWFIKRQRKTFIVIGVLSILSSVYLLIVKFTTNAT